MKASDKEQQLEYEFQNKGLTAERLTPAMIDSKIKNIHYHIVPESTTTLCSLELINGFIVNGESACALKENFDAQIGRTIAYENARDKIWQLEGYLLTQKLYEQGNK